jgi:hypothetical protein
VPILRGRDVRKEPNNIPHSSSQHPWGYHSGKICLALRVYLFAIAFPDQLVRFDVFTAVTMKNGVFWDVTQCGSSKNRS